MKEEEEEHHTEEEIKKKEIFGKHKINILDKYMDFKNKEDSFGDLSEYSWEFQGCDLYSRYLPELTEVMQNQMEYALKMTKNTYGNTT